MQKHNLKSRILPEASASKYFSNFIHSTFQTIILKVEFHNCFASNG